MPPFSLAKALSAPSLRSWACWAAVAALLALTWHKRVQELGLEIALQGGGPMWYTHKAAEPLTYERDFPGGTEQYRYSAPMHAYRFAWAWLGVRPERLLPAFVAFELAFMAAAFIVLLRTLRPGASPAVALLLVAFVVASGARDASLASLTLPFFRGLYHNVADGLCILGIAAMLRGRAVLAAALLGGGFASHPALSVPAAAFAFCPLIVRPRELLRPRNLAAAALLVAIVAAWAFGVLGYGAVAGQRFPPKLWFELTRFTCFHMYPIEHGVFTTEHATILVPFLSFALLAVYYLTRGGPLGETERKVALGLAAMATLVAAGVLFSAVDLSTALTKLALHRASAVAITVGIVYIAAGLWDDLGRGPWWRQVAAVVVLASPFVASPAYPLLFSLVLAAEAWRRPGRGLSRLAVGAVAAAGLLAVGLHAIAGTAATLTASGYTGLDWLLMPAALCGLGAFAVGLVAGRLAGLPSGRALGLLVLAACAAFWVSGDGLGPEDAAVARSYREAQLWAAANTPRDALFAPDPTIYYGWRDYSLRSSFGNVREWLYTSWLFNSDYRLCQEGLARLGEFGLDVRDYFGHAPAFAGFAALTQDVRRRFYGADDAWRAALARRHGIAFFVYQKRPAYRGLPHTKLPVAFQNAHFLILRAEP